MAPRKGRSADESGRCGGETGAQERALGRRFDRACLEREADEDLKRNRHYGGFVVQCGGSCSRHYLVLRHLSHLGLRVNWEKSKLFPVQRITFLSMELDSNMAVLFTCECAQSALLECVQGQDSGSTVSEAPGAYGIHSCSHATRVASYETASAVVTWPSHKMGYMAKSQEVTHQVAITPACRPVYGHTLLFQGAGEFNRAADELTRQLTLPGEWILHPQVVQLIQRHFGATQVDPFASPDTSHCQLFYSLTEGTLGMDALAHT
ncbi:unnamed protein product [Leuciscus chuanchicus]